MRSVYWKVIVPVVIVAAVCAAIAGAGMLGVGWALVLSILLAAGTGALIARSITTPVHRMTMAVRQMAAGQMDRKIKPGTNDELGQLGKAFDEMSASMKQALATLSGEKGKLDTVLSTMTDGVIVTDAAGNVDLANPAAARLCSFEEAQVRGQPFIELIGDHQMDTALRECLRTGRSQSLQTDSTTGRFLRVVVVPLLAGGTGGALIVLQDLTEMRSLQTMRREFVGNVSHELRTPLAAIKAIVETLEDGAIDDRPAAMDFLAKVDAEVDGLTQMVNELIELSRVETGKADLNMEPTNLNRILEQVVAHLSPQGERAGISLSVDLDPDIVMVPADGDRIYQITTNIVHNAIKFTAAGGKVVVRSKCVGDMVTVSVADTGAGISKEDQRHIFERFFKADRSRSTVGSGLGLAIAKHVVQAHRGKIWVESEEGRGSTFSYTLPMRVGVNGGDGFNKSLTKA